MAAPQARSWADLHTDLVHEIFDRVPCAADRHHAYLACAAWFEAQAGAPKLPPALPWLLLPAPDRDGATRVVCVLSGCRVHHLPFTTPGARFFGSHDGAWLFLHHGERDSHELVNLGTGDVRVIPGKISDSINITLHATALSSSPDDLECVAVSIATVPPHLLRFVTLCRMTWRDAIPLRPPGVPIDHFLADDVVYHDGAFYLLLSRSDDISVCTPQLLPAHGCSVEWVHRRFHPRGNNYDQPPVADRYLVSSRGQLLLVVRFEPHPYLTSRFKVFRATERPQNPEADAASDFPVAAYPWAWSELDTLDGRILFVRHGCSRSYDLHDAQGRVQYKGFKDAIYFLDDRAFHFLDAVQYPCFDNGRWYESDGRNIQLCFPPADPTWNSPPAWLLP